MCVWGQQSLSFIINKIYDVDLKYMPLQHLCQEKWNESPLNLHFASTKMNRSAGKTPLIKEASL